MKNWTELIIGIIVLSPLFAFVIYLLIIRRKQIKEEKIKNNSSFQLPADFKEIRNVKIIKQDGSTEDIFNKPLPKHWPGFLTDMHAGGNTKIDPKTHLPIKK